MIVRTPGKVVWFIFVLMLISTAMLFPAGSKEKSAVASVNGVMIPRAFLEREVRRFEQQALSQGQVVKVIYVPGRTMNFVVKP